MHRALMAWSETRLSRAREALELGLRGTRGVLLEAQQRSGVVGVTERIGGHERLAATDRVARRKCLLVSPSLASALISWRTGPMGSSITSADRAPTLATSNN
jgi:hypothetical protein